MHAHWRPAEVTDALRARTKEPRIVRNQDDARAVTDRDVPEDACVRADDHVVAYLRMADAVLKARAAEYDNRPHRFAGRQ